MKKNKKGTDIYVWFGFTVLAFRSCGCWSRLTIHCWKLTFSKIHDIATKSTSDSLSTCVNSTSTNTWRPATPTVIEILTCRNLIDQVFRSLAMWPEDLSSSSGTSTSSWLVLFHAVVVCVVDISNICYLQEHFSPWMAPDLCHPAVLLFLLLVEACVDGCQRWTQKRIWANTLARQNEHNMCF